MFPLKRLLPGMILLIYAVVPSARAQLSLDDPSVVFAENFESQTPRGWDDGDGNPAPDNVLVRIPSPTGKLTQAMRLRVPAGKRGGADLVKVLPQGYDRLYARWYVQYEPGFDFKAPNHGGGLHAGARSFLGRSDFRPRGDDWFSAWIEHETTTGRSYAYVYYRGMYQDCADPEGKCWGDQFPAIGTGAFEGKPQHRTVTEPPKLETGRWYCLEMMMDAGTPVHSGDRADGILTFWVDGVEIGPWTDLWLRSTPELKINTLWINLFHHDGTHSEAGILVDDIVVATNRIGAMARP